MKTNSIIKMIRWNEFITYFFIGATATMIDWGMFWVAVNNFGFHYEIALVSAYSLAGIFHFFANKFITFQCKSRNVGSQYVLYFLITLSSLAISMGIIAILINLLALESMTARILTTALMLVPNYLLHKNITFSKRLFAASNPTP
jgi:putative flippase GtrA